jgi:uncharacterized membrane protein YfcA
LVNGFLGVGGGTVLVPGLTLWLGVEEHEGHGTALAVIVPTALLSALVYAHKGLVDWSLALQIALGGVVGAYAGACLMPRLSAHTLRWVYGSFLLFAGYQLLTRR